MLDDCGMYGKYLIKCTMQKKGIHKSDLMKASRLQRVYIKEEPHSPTLLESLDHPSSLLHLHP